MAYTRRYSWDGGTVEGWAKHYGTPTVALSVAAVASAGSAGSLRVDLSAVPTSGFVNAAVYDAGQLLGGAVAGGNLRAVVRQETGGAGWSYKPYWQDKTANFVVHATPGAALTAATWVDYAALPDATVPSDNTLINGFGIEFFNNGPAQATASFSIDFYEQGTADNPVPTATELVPSLALATGAAFTLQVFGTNFVTGSVVRWAGVDRTTTFVSATEVRAAIPATDIGAAGTPSVAVFNPTPGGGLSGALTFTVRAAPSAARWYANGAQPTGISPIDALNALRLQYDWWRHYTLTQTGMPAAMPAGAWRVRVPDQNDPTTGRPNGTFSEGIGYGLLIMGWMGDPANPVYDPGARAYADGLWTYYKFFRDANGLMNWRIDDLGNVTGTGGATDGDHDSAFGLLLAHRNYGSAGAVNYLADGTALINAIDSTEFTPASDPAPHVMTNGDQWGFATDRYMPDYFAPGFYRVFGQVVTGSRWPTIISTNYPKAQGYFMSTFTTGMVPDECNRAGATVTGTSYKYAYNAIRFPFRVSLDYLWNGAATDALAKSAPLRLANFHRDPLRANGVPVNSRAEWVLDGSASATYTNLAFVSGYGIAGTVDTTTAGWAGACAAFLRDNARESSYFGTCLSTLGLLVLAGQAQPYSAAAPDTTPPVLSAIAAGSITASGVTIGWTTNEAADTQVEYGTTTTYGATTALNATMVTTHSQGLTGLLAGTSYHYRVKSKDAAGNLATSADQTFTTSAAPDLTALAPGSTPAGSAGFTLVVTGTGFAAGSSVRWNGANRTTTYVSATELRAAIPASDVATTGTVQVTVV